MIENCWLSFYKLTYFLDNNEAIAEYLTQVLNDGDTNELLEAIGNIAKAKRMAQIAKDTGLRRESLYRAFTPGAKPRFEKILKVLNSLGVKLQASA